MAQNVEVRTAHDGPATTICVLAPEEGGTKLMIPYDRTVFEEPIVAVHNPN